MRRLKLNKNMKFEEPYDKNRRRRLQAFLESLFITTLRNPKIYCCTPSTCLCSTLRRSKATLKISFHCFSCVTLPLFVGFISILSRDCSLPLSIFQVRSVKRRNRKIMTLNTTRLSIASDRSNALID